MTKWRINGIRTVSSRSVVPFQVAEEGVDFLFTALHLPGMVIGAHLVVAIITSNTAGKRSPGKEIHQLRKQQLASVHRRLQRQSLESASRQFQIDTT
jgi:hypothetical protein